MWKIIFILLALAYVLNPYDILPDLLIGWGWLDDLVVLGLLVRYLYTLKKKKEAFQKYYQHQKAYRSERTESENGKGPYTQANSGGSSEVWDPYKVLDIERGASQQDIKQAYRNLAGKYHPDRVEHLGEEFKALANKRFKEIQRAYQEVKRE